ncbi:MAG: hypothetical protein IJC33_01895 [Clostridia bacterium]|nr:hypothetical protein [Clostridia bacterium]
MLSLRRTSKKVLLTLLALALVATAVIGTYAWSWQGAEMASFDAKYDKDGFVFGVRYSQIGAVHNKGRSLAGNNILADKEECGFWEPSVREDFFNMKALGLDAVTINLFTLLEGVEFDEAGQITGLDPAFLDNLKVVMNTAIENDLKVAVALQPALNELAYGVAGASKATWDKYTQLYYSETVRAQYIEKCVKPALAVLKDYENILLYIAIVSQPEKDIAEIQGSWGTTWGKMVEFVADVNDVCKETLPKVATTVETEAAYLSKFNGIALGAAGADLYTDAGKADDLADATSAFPMYLSRYGIKKGNSATEEFLVQKNRDILNSAIDKGYMGAFFDEWISQQTTRTVFLDGTLRQWALTMYFAAESYRDTRNDNWDDKPVKMLYNHNDGNVQWVGSALASTYTVERSADDGATWVAITDALDAGSVSNSYFLCSYKDDNREDGVTYRYRVISDGSIVSEPTN